MKQKTKKPASRNKIRNGERVRLERVVRRQANELKIKNGQLRNGAQRRIALDAQIKILTKAIEATIDGIFIVDAQTPNFPVVYANQSFRNMVGFSKREILGRSYFLLYGIDVDSRIINEIRDKMHIGKFFHGEMLNFKKNGKKYWNSLRIAPVRDPGGAVTHYVGIQSNITLLREKELEINEQREELLHVTRVGKLAEFVSSLAHEISQPLTAILSYAQAAQRILADREPKLHKILSYIINDDQRAAEVIWRLRSLLKKGKPVFEPLDINLLVNATAKLMATDIAVRNRILKIKADTNLPTIRGDRIQLQQVILNLVSNSLDSMESRDDYRGIVVCTSRKGPGEIMVEVKDSGCGIPEANMKKLFHHFFTSKPDGLGMGLSISRSIVEAHGGRLDVKNNPKGGATFYFTIPIVSEERAGTKERP
ncbi:MAG: ATP-binding protein [Candidatus Omnitrophota bacterium]